MTDGLVDAWHAFLRNADQETPCEAQFFYDPERQRVEYAGSIVGMNKGWERIPVPYAPLEATGVGDDEHWARFAASLTAPAFERWIKVYENGGKIERQSA